jgi:arylformamidase
MLYGRYDQAALDAQYNLRARIADHEEYFARYARESARARDALPSRPDLAYGDAPAETLDLFFPTIPPGSIGAPVLVFIHGGYWRSLDKRDFSFVAWPFVAAGAAVAVPNYALAPAATLDEIVHQCRAALAWLHANGGRFGLDSGRIFVSGHSAGGHLAAMVVATDWPHFGRGLPPDLVKGACAVSGIFDLEPIRLSFLNADLRLDADAARRNSPLHHLPPPGTPLILALGQEESEEYHRQTRDFAAACAQAGSPCEVLALPGLHHFSVVEELGRAASPLTAAMLRLMGLGA